MAGEAALLQNGDRSRGWLRSAKRKGNANCNESAFSHTREYLYLLASIRLNAALAAYTIVALEDQGSYPK